MTLVIAHRGASGAAQENTITAFRLAREMGADGVELDVRRTADDALVVNHDAALADGRVVRATRSADLPDHVPTLAAALDACEGMFVNIEIKNIRREPDFDPSEWIAHHVLAELERRAEPQRWLLSSFRLATVDLCRSLQPEIRTAWLVDQVNHKKVDRAIQHGHTAIHPNVVGLQRDVVGAARAGGLAVNVWTCNDADRMRELVAWGVDGICTDVPDVARSVLGG